jgi:5-methyltetrahydrofolate corrinoid/iron sulfur protein methyltransferase
MMTGGFVVIGENIHTTRVVLRKGRRVTEREGREVVLFAGPDGGERALPVSEAAKRGQDYEQGRIKHVKLALEAAMSDEPEVAAQGIDYLAWLAAEQERGGAAYLDLNVDEISLRPAEQQRAMAWLVAKTAEITPLPVSVDSSNIDVIRAGLEAWEPARGRPLLNSASLERLEALDLAKAHDALVIVTAAGAKGMPSGPEERLVNASAMVEGALAKGIALADIFVDPLYFPISVDQSFGLHSFEAIRAIREKWGAEIHISGGMSNVSFGIPGRKVINDVFLALAVEAGADSGIMDPVLNPLDGVLNLDRNTETYRLAEDVLMGRDEYCANYIRAWRKGMLEGVPKPSRR